MPKADSITIQPIGFHPAVAHAAAELARYLPRLAPVRARALEPRAVVPGGSEPAIVLGTSESLANLGLGSLPASHELHDALAILPRRGRHYLVGANPRSVLFAAYRLLEELGVVFLRPGPGGEVVPGKRRLDLPARPIREQASYRHRGICIEGSPRLEHVLGLLDWMAKKKMNSFQLQFRHAGVFWRRGYQAPEMDPASRAHRLSETDCLTLDGQVIARVRQLGMMVHRVGHGWTAATLGYDGTSWEKEPVRELPPHMRDWPALVGGQRDIWHQEPVNTELCYANPVVRAAFVETVLSYARRRSEVDVLHVWLSDAYNNRCECPACRERTPSDWYALVIDEVGRRIKAEGLGTRVVFLAYVDLLWPPETHRFASDNLIFMFAPITRCFRHPLADPRCDDGASVARPPLNQCRLSRGNRAHAELARAWRQIQPPDSFIYDYHLWSSGAVWSTGLGLDVGSVMAQDIKDLAGLGLNGFMSCQCVRAFYPLPYLPNAMADTLWNARLAAGNHRQQIMEAGFGPHAGRVEEYFRQLVRLFRVGGEYEHRTILDDPGSHRDRLARAASLAREANAEFAATARASHDEVVRTSLRILAAHAEQVHFLAEVHLIGLARDEAALDRLRTRYQRRVVQVLRDLGPWVDPLFTSPVERAFAAAERQAASS